MADRRVLTSGVVLPVAYGCAIIVPLVLAAWIEVPGPPLIKQMALAAWGVGMTIAFERFMRVTSLQDACRAVGFAGCRRSLLLAALLANIPMWSFLPLVGAWNGVAISARSDWPALLLGVVLVNGITEEVIHRGFIFRHLRSRWSFGRAAAMAAAVFAAQHLYLALTVGWIAGLSSVVLALLVAFPFAFAFEQGPRSIAAPAILHTGSNAPMWIWVSADGALTSWLVPHMGVVLVSLYSVFLLGKRRDVTLSY